MADILIRGMEMPKSCDVCPFAGTNDDLMSDDYRYLYCGFPYMGQFVTDYEATRHPDCPLAPLPEGHGRLVDAREVLKKADKAPWFDGDVSELGLLLGSEVTTIVPAEGGADDGN